MKKNGFTLAEVLVTLSIIGVVSAITLPALLSNTTDSQIGPKLAKAVSAFEQANEALLNAESVDTLSDARLLVSGNASSYIDNLANHMKINRTSANEFRSKDNYIYTVTITSPSPANPAAPAYQQRIGDLNIDIDPSNGRRITGTDSFMFSLWNDGSLRPWGATNWDGTNDNTYHWTVTCPTGEAPTGDVFCAGHIFENNLKVLYK